MTDQSEIRPIYPVQAVKHRITVIVLSTILILFSLNAGKIETLPILNMKLDHANQKTVFFGIFIYCCFSFVFLAFSFLNECIVNVRAYNDSANIGKINDEMKHLISSSKASRDAAETMIREFEQQTNDIIGKIPLADPEDINDIISRSQVFPPIFERLDGVEKQIDELNIDDERHEIICKVKNHISALRENCYQVPDMICNFMNNGNMYENIVVKINYSSKQIKKLLNEQNDVSNKLNKNIKRMLKNMTLRQKIFSIDIYLNYLIAPTAIFIIAISHAIPILTGFYLMPTLL